MDEEENKSGETATLDPSKIKKIKLNADMIEAAQEAGHSMTEHLAQLEAEEGYEAQGGASELDAFERQLAARNLDINNAARLVGDFYATDTDNKYLFPEFISRQVYLGMRLGRKALRLEDLVSIRERTASGTAVSHDIDLGKEDLDAKKVAEGGSFPIATIKDRKKAIFLEKVGRELNVSYEAMARWSLPFAQVFFQRFGFRLSRQVTAAGLKIMRDGDGNAGTAAAVSNAGGTWDYAKLIDFLFNTANEEHEYTHVCCNRTFLIQILTDSTNFPQFQSQNVVEAFLRTGEIPDFLGMNWRVHANMVNESIIAWDAETALRLHEDNVGVMVESEKIISRQVNKSVVSYAFGFTKDWNGASAYRTKS